jgi:WYL domain
MGNSTNENNWAARERLRRVEVLLWWRGWVGRSDLTEVFGISSAQASGDLQRYAELNPGSMIYQTRRKRYEGAPEMRCVLHVPVFEEALRELLGVTVPLAACSDNDQVAAVTMPMRACDPAVARRVMIALLENRWLEVKYASLASGTHEWRSIAPARFAWDGQRWHVRAWCGKNAAWRDFVLGRMSAAKWPHDPAESLPVDEAWETIETVRLKINPELSPEKREALRMDYGLTGDAIELRVREAMKPYLLANLYIDESHRELPRHFVEDA